MAQAKQILPGLWLVLLQSMITLPLVSTVLQDGQCLMQMGSSSKSSPTKGVIDEARDDLSFAGIVPPVSPDDAPNLTPKQFMMISSPSEKKIVWTTLSNMQTAEGRPFALVDSGLEEPKGLAFDRNAGHLYVADSGLKKIFRYTVLADVSGSEPKLTTSGVRLTVTQGHAVESLTLDNAGNLFYTCPDTNNINKITAVVLDKIAKGEFKPGALTIVSEKVLEAKQAAKRLLALKKAQMLAACQDNMTQDNMTGGCNVSDPLPTDAPPVQPHIYSMYEAELNSHVSSPSSLWADGPDLYWTNTKDGKSSGTVVKGQVDPKSQNSTNGPSAFPAVALTNTSEGAFFLGKSEKVMFFTRNGTLPNTGLVTGLLEGPGILIDFVQSIQKPRGLAWDKDQTMYVADEGSGVVWSFPAGRMMANVPLSKAVTMKGAYGLMILSTSDPAFAHNSVEPEALIQGPLTSAEDSRTAAMGSAAAQADSPVNLLQEAGSYVVSLLR